VWADAVKLHGAAREDFLGTVARQRMLQLANACANHAADWRLRVSAPPMTLDWYEQYGETSAN
jgi:hypothetical protein